MTIDVGVVDHWKRLDTDFLQNRICFKGTRITKQGIRGACTREDRGRADFVGVSS